MDIYQALHSELEHFFSLIAPVYIGMFCKQHHLNHSGNKLWAGMFQTWLRQSLVLSSLAIHQFCDECRRHLSSSWLWSQLYENLIAFLSSLVKLIHVQSIYALVILISSYSRHQHQPSLVWLLFATVDVWFASLPLRVFCPNLGTRFFLGGRLWQFMYL
jgi:hypothetical protein